MEHEYRFLLLSSEARRFVALASEHLKQNIYDVDRPVAYTRTTYYDTEDRRYYRRVGNVNRRVRVRQYASAVTPTSSVKLCGPVFLEYKESSGAQRRKLRYCTTTPDLNRLLGDRWIRDVERQSLKQLPEVMDAALAIRAGVLKPIFSTWYRRMSLSHEGVRLTVDENVAFCPPMAMGAQGQCAEPDECLSLIAGRIVELKVTGALPSWLSSALQQLEGTESVSKFRRGMEIIANPGLRPIHSTRPLTVLAPTSPLGNQ